MEGQDYRVGVTSTGIDADGGSVHGDLRLDELTRHGLDWVRIEEDGGDGDLSGLDALYIMGGRRVDARTLSGNPRLRHVARFGAGYDAIDVPACTEAGVVVTTTPMAIRRPLALAALTLILAVTHNLVQKHRITRESRWEERGRWRGRSTDGSAVAIVGFGSVGGELARMLIPLGYSVSGVNRRRQHPVAEELGIPLVSLEEALGADVVVLCAPLTDQTRGMMGADQFALMRSDAAFINVGRGALVDQAALTAALREGRIRAAGLDVFDPEPPASDDPLLSLPNVTLAPHSLCWTESFTAAVTSSANAALIAASRGEQPATALNPAAFDHPRWR